MKFKIASKYKPAGDQPEAIEKLVKGLESGKKSLISRGNHIDVESKDCFIHAENKLVATVGLQNVIIIETEDAILVADKNSAGEVKKIIEKLKDKGQKYL